MIQDYFEKLKKILPTIPPDFIKSHLERLEKRYFECFNLEQIASHIKLLFSLTPTSPVEIIIEKKEKNIHCTILAFDYPSLLSLITGVLAATGFNILSGDVFTYKRIILKKDKKKHTLRSSIIKKSIIERRRIIDYFCGVIDEKEELDRWSRSFKQSIIEIIKLMEAGDPHSITLAKQKVNEMVANRLRAVGEVSPSILYPIKIETDNKGEYTSFKITAEDTPAFLYSLSTALSSRNIMIEHVKIRTVGSKVEDIIEVVDTTGKKIDNKNMLDQIKLSILLTKQFTYFLEKAPDPYSALSRFESLIEDILQLPQQGKWIELLSNPRILKDLARLLGMSDYIWEDFIRTQYETLLPLLEPYIENRDFIQPIETIDLRLQQILRSAKNLEEKKRKINEFKDQEIFLIDLEHILNPNLSFQHLSEKLTILAETIIRTSVEILYQELTKRFGSPTTAAGLKTKFAVFGLGKLGGAALGYASDIELLLIYSDNGFTNGEESISNREFFEILVKELKSFIKAKREGIFNIDLRLRPYGNDGPLACSLETFCKYYAPGGKAHSYERLALVRLRTIAGNKEFGRQVERLRDEIIYSPKSINLEELRKLREKQFQEKNIPGKLNAKFSPGALVDLEYTVQILQIIHGRDVPELRTPKLHEALQVLKQKGILGETECRQLIEAYAFLRNLINALRILRGSAQDLFLPSIDSSEFSHLARRMGYEDSHLDPAYKLKLDFDTHTATVRAFVERHLGRDSLPGPKVGNIADIILSDNIEKELIEKILSSNNFKNVWLAYQNLKKLGEAQYKEVFAKLAVLAIDILKENPDPDMALNNWERFIQFVENPLQHYEMLLSQPVRLEVLLSIFGGSQFLADTLIRNPNFLDWVLNPENFHYTRTLQEIIAELRGIKFFSTNHTQFLNYLRLFKKREILRIGTRDIYLHAPLQEITYDLSLLAQGILQTVLNNRIEMIHKEIGYLNINLKDNFCIIALGKLGGNELNYSSDIDLLGIYEESSNNHDSCSKEDILTLLLEKVCHDLSFHTEEGYLYRVDLRLRPYGSSGKLTYSLYSLEDYYKNRASIWELQALLKATPIAGNIKVGKKFLSYLRPIFIQRCNNPALIIASIEQLRNLAIKEISKKYPFQKNVKTGIGGIRDIEFLVQGLQLIFVKEYAELMEPNTLNALKKLETCQILPSEVVRKLEAHYIFLRKVEHFLQIMEDRQTHSLPANKEEIEALARRIMGVRTTAKEFLEFLETSLQEVRALYKQYLLEKKYEI